MFFFFGEANTCAAYLCTWTFPYSEYDPARGDTSFMNYALVVVDLHFGLFDYGLFVIYWDKSNQKPTLGSLKFDSI